MPAPWRLWRSLRWRCPRLWRQWRSRMSTLNELMNKTLDGTEAWRTWMSRLGIGSILSFASDYMDILAAFQSKSCCHCLPTFLSNIPSQHCLHHYNRNTLLHVTSVCLFHLSKITVSALPAQPPYFYTTCICFIASVCITPSQLHIDYLASVVLNKKLSRWCLHILTVATWALRRFHLLCFIINMPCPMAAAKPKGEKTHARVAAKYAGEGALLWRWFLGVSFHCI